MCGKVFKASKPTQLSQKYSYDELFQLISEIRLHEADLNASQYPVTVIGRNVAVAVGKGKEAVMALKNAMIGWGLFSATDNKPIKCCKDSNNCPLGAELRKLLRIQQKLAPETIVETDIQRSDRSIALDKQLVKQRGYCILAQYSKGPCSKKTITRADTTLRPIQNGVQLINSMNYCKECLHINLSLDIGHIMCNTCYMKIYHHGGHGISSSSSSGSSNESSTSMTLIEHLSDLKRRQRNGDIDKDRQVHQSLLSYIAAHGSLYHRKAVDLIVDVLKVKKDSAQRRANILFETKSESAEALGYIVSDLTLHTSCVLTTSTGCTAGKLDPGNAYLTWSGYNPVVANGFAPAIPTAAQVTEEAKEKAYAIVIQDLLAASLERPIKSWSQYPKNPDQSQILFEQVPLPIHKLLKGLMINSREHYTPQEIACLAGILMNMITRISSRQAILPMQAENAVVFKSGDIGTQLSLGYLAGLTSKVDQEYRWMVMLSKSKAPESPLTNKTFALVAKTNVTDEDDDLIPYTVYTAKDGQLRICLAAAIGDNAQKKVANQFRQSK